MAAKKISVIISAYNESKHITNVLGKTKKYAKSIIVVDDGSRDNTAELAKKEGVIVLKHIVNLGKGAAMKTGCEYAIKKGIKLLIMMDADGQHDPAEIPNFVSQIKSKKVDIVFGSRRLSAKMPFARRLGNWLITRATKILFGVDLRDTQSGFRAFTSYAYKKIRWKSTGYAVESEMIANVGKHKLKYSEIPIQTIYLDKYKGMNIVEGMKIALRMMWWRLTK